MPRVARIKELQAIIPEEGAGVRGVTWILVMRILVLSGRIGKACLLKYFGWGGVVVTEYIVLGGAS